MPHDVALFAVVAAWLQKNWAFVLNNVVLAAIWLVWKARTEARHARALEGLKAGHAQTLEALKADYAQTLEGLKAGHAQTLEALKADYAQTLERVKVELAGRSRHAEAVQGSIAEVQRALSDSIEGRGPSPAQVFPELEACREKLVQAELVLSLSLCMAAHDALDEWEEIAASSLAAMLRTATTRAQELDRQRLHDQVGASAARLTAMLRSEAALVLH